MSERLHWRRLLCTIVGCVEVVAEYVWMRRVTFPPSLMVAVIWTGDVDEVVVDEERGLDYFPRGQVDFHLVFT